MSYAKLRPQLASGDLVLFSGTGVVSDWLKRLQPSRWSHVGMIVRALDLDAVLCWESTTLATVPDVTTGRVQQGVMLVDLGRRLAAYPGRAAIRRLLGPRPPAMLAALAAIRHVLNGRPYERHPLDLFLAQYDGPGGAAVPDLSSLFCSEMVAVGWQAMGLLPASVVPGELTPRDFSTEARNAWVERLLPAGYSLTPEWPIRTGHRAST